MPEVLAVNNYPSLDRFDILRDSLISNGADLTVAGWQESTATAFNRVDGVVLSGSPAMLSDGRVRAKFAKEIDAIKETKVPLLGVCFGLQLIGCAFGSRVVKNGPMVKEYADTTVLLPDLLFKGLPPTIRVFESHEEVVEPLPRDFVLLARSRSSPVAAVRHFRFPIRGVQFHPERNGPDAPDGGKVLANFVGSLR